MRDKQVIIEVHGGKFACCPYLDYIGERIDYLDNVVLDFLSYFELVHVLRRLNFPDHMSIHYKLPDCNLSDGLRLLMVILL